MTTDDYILALTKPGGKFVLPGCLEWKGGRNIRYWFLASEYGGGSVELLNEEVKVAHDLCAMSFARQKNGTPIAADRDAMIPFYLAMQSGDSAAAIKALYDALEKS